MGQFGGSSAYLQKRMAFAFADSAIRLRYSQSGKLDVVRGAIFERLNLGESFVHKFEILKSYGSLLSLPYDEEVRRQFPDPKLHGAVPFEQSKEGLRLMVVEWAVPAVCSRQDDS